MIHYSHLFTNLTKLAEKYQSVMLHSSVWFQNKSRYFLKKISSYIVEIGNAVHYHVNRLFLVTKISPGLGEAILHY